MAPRAPRTRKPRRRPAPAAVKLTGGAVVLALVGLLVTWATKYPRTACGVVELFCREVKQAEPPAAVPPPVPTSTPTAGGPPPEPVPGQVRARDGRCPGGTVDLGGACWIRMDIRPPCPEVAVAYEGHCYAPYFAPARFPSVQDPRRGLRQ